MVGEVVRNPEEGVRNLKVVVRNLKVVVRNLEGGTLVTGIVGDCCEGVVVGVVV
jgi:hypothetical protein